MKYTININRRFAEITSLPIPKFTLRSLVFIAFILFASGTISAQSKTVAETKKSAIEALQNNDIEAFTSTFSDPIEITLPNAENSYSKKQASIVIRNFLKKNIVKTFKVKQSGKSTGGAEFIIGEMTTTTGKKYEVYLLITLINEKAYLHLIEFELI